MALELFAGGVRIKNREGALGYENSTGKERMEAFNCIVNCARQQSLTADTLRGKLEEVRGILIIFIQLIMTGIKCCIGIMLFILLEVLDSLT